MERGELFGMEKGTKFSDKKPHLPKVRPGVSIDLCHGRVSGINKI